MKNRYALGLLFSSNTISGCAQGISMISIPWYFSTIIGNPGGFGRLYFTASLLSLLWTLYAGTIVDRFDRKKIMQVYSAIGAITLLIAALLPDNKEAGIELIAGVVFCITFLIYNIHYPNLYAFAQEITEPKDYGKVTSYIEIQGQVTSALAGGFAAFLLKGAEHGKLMLAGLEVDVGFSLQAWSLKEIFLLNAGTYLVSFLLVSAIYYQRVASRNIDTGGVWQRFKTGVTFFRQHPRIFTFGINSFAVFITILILGFYLQPSYISLHLQQDADVYALYEFFFAAGSIFSGLFIRHLWKGVNTVVAILLMSLLVMVIYLTSIWNTALWFFFLGTFFVGLCNAGIRIMRVVLFFRIIPNEVTGRAQSVIFTYNVLMRLLLTAVFIQPFFYTDGNIVLTYAILAAFVGIAIIGMLFQLKSGMKLDR